MKNIRIFISVIILTGLIAASIAAEVPKLITYSGKLTDKQGNLVPDGDYDMKFVLWDHETSTAEVNKIWEEQHLIIQSHGVPIRGGGFNVWLGGINSLPIFDKNYYLALTFYKDGIWNDFHRQKIISVPYAIRAEYANEAVLANSIADNTVNSAKIADQSVNTADIANSAVDSSKVANGVIDNQAKAPWASLVAVNGQWRNYPKIACGLAGTDSNGNCGIDLSPYGFTQTPMIVCSPIHDSYQVSCTIYGGATNKYFSVCTRYGDEAGYPTSFNWIAIGY